jgi:hypothetical protein
MITILIILLLRVKSLSHQKLCVRMEQNMTPPPPTFAYRIRTLACVCVCRSERRGKIASY